MHCAVEFSPFKDMLKQFDMCSKENNSDLSPDSFSQHHPVMGGVCVCMILWVYYCCDYV